MLSNFILQGQKAMTEDQVATLESAAHRAHEAADGLLTAVQNRDAALASASLGLICAVGFGPLSKNDAWLKMAGKDKKFADFAGIASAP